MLCSCSRALKILNVAEVNTADTVVELSAAASWLLPLLPLLGATKESTQELFFLTTILAECKT
jgi:hypothetical protein